MEEKVCDFRCRDPLQYWKPCSKMRRSSAYDPLPNRNIGAATNCPRFAATDVIVVAGCPPETYPQRIPARWSSLWNRNYRHQVMIGSISRSALSPKRFRPIGSLTQLVRERTGWSGSSRVRSPPCEYLDYLCRKLPINPEAAVTLTNDELSPWRRSHNQHKPDLTIIGVWPMATTRW